MRPLPLKSMSRNLITINLILIGHIHNGIDNLCCILMSTNKAKVVKMTFDLPINPFSSTYTYIGLNNAIKVKRPQSQ